VERPADARRSGPPDLASPGFTPLPAHVPWDVEGFEVSDDGRTVAFVTNEGGISRLHLLDATTGREKTAPKLPVGLITSLVSQGARGSGRLHPSLGVEPWIDRPPSS
jgi:hypothetical protein